MNLTDKKSTILLDLSAEPQRQAKASQGIAAIEAGIAELAQLGYRFAAVEAETTHTPSEPQEYPKMLYRATEYPFEVTVDDGDAEAEARKRGYTGPLDAPPSQSAMNSQPLNPTTAPPVHAPKPPITDHDVLEQRIANNSGASTPTTDVGKS